MKKVALLTTAATGFVMTTVIPAMAGSLGGGGSYGGGGNSAPAVDIGSGLLGNIAALGSMSVVLLMLFRQRSRN